MFCARLQVHADVLHHFLRHRSAYWLGTRGLDDGLGGDRHKGEAAGAIFGRVPSAVGLEFRWRHSGERRAHLLDSGRQGGTRSEMANRQVSHWVEEGRWLWPRWYRGVHWNSDPAGARCTTTTSLRSLPLERKRSIEGTRGRKRRPREQKHVGEFPLESPSSAPGEWNRACYARSCGQFPRSGRIRRRAAERQAAACAPSLGPGGQRTPAQQLPEIAFEEA